MPDIRTASEMRLLNGSTGDPVLYVDYPASHNALLFDAGDNASLPLEKLADLTAVFVTHHHVDHFIGFDRIVRATIDSDKTLSVFGPVGTIAKTYDRIRSYEYPFFPFQKLALRITEIHADRLRTGLLECRKQFPEPVIADSPWDGVSPVFENGEVAVEAGLLDHTVPCLGFALREKPGYALRTARLDEGLLRPGPWIGEVRQALMEGTLERRTIEIETMRLPAKALADRYFTKLPGARIAYIVDTAGSDASRPVLLRLAHKADRLYCDSFYAESEAKSADKHRHLTATRAARLAKEAHAQELVLIHFAKRYAKRYDRLVGEARAIFPRTFAEFT
jgi:ribonuclease Z